MKAYKPKIICDYPENLYHEQVGLSATSIKYILQDPLLFWWNSSMNPKKTHMTTDAMEFGSALHKMIFELSEFNKEYEIIEPRIKYKGDKKPIRQPRHQEAEDMHQELLDMPFLREFIKGGIAELSFSWEEISQNGTAIPMRARFDYLQIAERNGKLVVRIIDYKSIASITPYKYRYNILDFGYDIQAQNYINALKHMQENEPEIQGNNTEIRYIKKALEADEIEFVFVFQEKIPPYQATGVTLDEFTLTNAQTHIDTAKEIYAKFITEYGTNRWGTDNDRIEKVCIEDFGSKYDFIYMDRIRKAEELQIQLNRDENITAESF